MEENIVNGRNVWQKSLDRYFEIRPFEESGRIYELLGIRAYRKVWHATMGALLNRGKKREYLSNFSDESLNGMENLTKKIEKTHLKISAAYVPILLFATSQEQYILAFIGLGANMATNIYPIMLQRYHRAKVERILKHRKEKRGVNI